MDKLIQQFQLRLKSTDLTFRRYLRNEINWDNRLIGITGARGVGKTTLILQHIKERFKTSIENVLYVSLDNLYFSKTTLSDFADEFVKQDGKSTVMSEWLEGKDFQQLHAEDTVTIEDYEKFIYFMAVVRSVSVKSIDGRDYSKEYQQLIDML